MPTVTMKHPVPEVLDVKLVEYVKRVFQKADKDGGGDLDEEEFVAAFTGRLQTDEGTDAACNLSQSNQPSQLLDIN
jgi:Ca2+-binding EF-hand superfamily protein